jgi:glycosyltransferase involved in cell wall biosynthesis
MDMENFSKDRASLSPSQIWVVNPFDQIPNESDVALRYWSLCRTFAEQGHNVIWWSSDFSHRHKIKREPCQNTDGFVVRLIETPPYKKNISFARLRNHKAFANGFYSDAMKELKSGELKHPNRIIVSLPPLGVAEIAFRIRDFVRKAESKNIQGEKSTSDSPCEVIVDIMDAWPEAFYRVLPKTLRNFLGPILLAPMHRSAKRAYQCADKISGVGQSYIDLAQRYLHSVTEASIGVDKIQNGAGASLLQTPLHLCYHGTDLSRFERDRGVDRSTRHQGDAWEHLSSQVSTQAIKHSKNRPLRAVYIGAMGYGYDLQTVIGVAERWKAEGILPFQIHFAGTGPQLDQLKARCKKLGLLKLEQDSDRASENEPNNNLASSSKILSTAPVVFHGFLKKDAVNELLLSSDIALVTNRPDSLVACPYKAGEYAAASLPIISCLEGELGELLGYWNAGSEYNEGDVASLHDAFRSYSTDLDLLKQQRLNARKMAEALFDREKTYQELSEFILIPALRDGHSIVEPIAPE